MPVIKRYPNRKLYDTDAKQYITLEEIAAMIRDGQEIQVIDNATGEDLTALTLTQIIVELEKKQSGFLPLALLSSLIQAGGGRWSALQRSLTSHAGWWRQVDEEIKRRIHTMIDAGEISEREGKSLLEKLLAPALRPIDEITHRSTDVTRQRVEQYLEERDIPSQNDMQRLIKQLDELSSRLDEMSNP